MTEPFQRGKMHARAFSAGRIDPCSFYFLNMTFLDTLFIKRKYIVKVNIIDFDEFSKKVLLLNIVFWD